MNRQEFLKQVAEGRLLQIYLLLGEERLFREELFQAALHKLLTPEEVQFNYMRLDASGVSAEELISNLETPPFFGGARVIYLADLENGSGLDEAVLKGLSHLAGGVYLFLTAAKLDGRKKSTQEIRKRIVEVDCSKISPGDLPLWLKQRSEKMGLQLTSEQIRTIAQRLGPDLLHVRTELEKIRTFLGNNKSLNNQELDALIPVEPEPNIFGLIDAVADRNSRLGLPRLEELLNSGENEIKILATLARQFRNITAAREARSRGMNPKALAELLGINPYVSEKSFSQSAQFTLAELQKIMERLVWADYRMKTGQREMRLELELTIVEICTKAT